jgi:hypothetical protein
MTLAAFAPVLQVLQIGGSSLFSMSFMESGEKKMKLVLSVGLLASTTLAGFQGIGLGILGAGIQILTAGLANNRKRKELISCGVAMIALPILANKFFLPGLLPLMRIHSATYGLFAAFLAASTMFAVAKHDDKEVAALLTAISVTVLGTLTPHPYIIGLGMALGNSFIFS